MKINFRRVLPWSMALGMVLAFGWGFNEKVRKDIEIKSHNTTKYNLAELQEEYNSFKEKMDDQIKEIDELVLTFGKEKDEMIKYNDSLKQKNVFYEAELQKYKNSESRYCQKKQVLVDQCLKRESKLVQDVAILRKGKDELFKELSSNRKSCYDLISQIESEFEEASKKGMIGNIVGCE